MSAKPLYGANTSATITLDSLADGGDASSTEVDNSTTLALGLDVEVNLKGSNAGETGRVSIYLKRGNETGVLETDENATMIGSVALNGTTAVRKDIRVDDIPKFYMIYVKHASSSTYALNSTGNTIKYQPFNIQDV